MIMSSSGARENLYNALISNVVSGFDRVSDWDSAVLSGPVYPTPPPIGLQYIG